MIFEILVFVFSLLLLFTFKRQPSGFPKGPIGIPLLGYLPWLLPDIHVQIGKLREKYGDIFSIKLGSETYVVINEFELIKESMKMEVFSGRPNHLLAMSVMKNGLIFNQGPSWVEQRRFSLKTLRDFGFGKQSMEAMIHDAAQDWVNHYRENIGQPVEIKKIFPVVALNALWAMIAGEKLEIGQDSKPMRIFHLGKTGVMEPAMSGPLYAMPWLAKLLPELSGYNLLKKAKQEIDVLSKEIIDEHKKTICLGSPRDYIDVYLEKMNEAEAVPRSSFYKAKGDTNLIDSIFTFFLAGADTLTSSIDFTILFLLKHPKVMEKVHKEIDRVLGRARLPCATDRQSMPYVEAVMQETFRLSSILTTILHSTLEDIAFHGYFLPKGTIIYPNYYQVHHDVKYWGDPEAFRPERFINTDGSFRKDERVIPFGIGKRECLAANMAIVEYFIFLTTLLQAFDIEADPNAPLPPNEAKTAAVLAPQSYQVLLKERK